MGGDEAVTQTQTLSLAVFCLCSLKPRTGGLLEGNSVRMGCTSTSRSFLTEFPSCLKSSQTSLKGLISPKMQQEETRTDLSLVSVSPVLEASFAFPLLSLEQAILGAQVLETSGEVGSPC